MFTNLQCGTGRPKIATANNFYGAWRIVTPDKITRPLLDARFYISSTGATTACCVWLFDGYACGTAGGWGYDRESQTFCIALGNMGLDRNVLRKDYEIAGGVGMNHVINMLMEKVMPKDAVSFYVGG